MRSQIKSHLKTTIFNGNQYKAAKFYTSVECTGFLLLFLSFTFYSSASASLMPVNSIYAHYALGIFWLGLTALTDVKAYSRFRKEFFFIALLFSLLLAIGSATAMSGDSLSLLGYGSKLLLIFLILASFQLGLVQARKISSMRRLSSFALMLIPVGFVLYLTIPGQNANWLGIYILFCGCLRSVICEWGVLRNIIFVSLTGLCAVAFLDSQGVLVTCGIAALFLTGRMAFSVFSTTFRDNYYRVATAVVLFGGIIFSLWIASLFGSEQFLIISSMSQNYIGDDLGLARSIRWATAFEAALDRPIAGYGLEAALPRVFQDPSIGAYIHNIWLDILLRFGLLGLIIYGVMFYWLIRRTLKPRCSENAGLVLIVFFLTSLVYSLGGYTHIPGTLGFWYLMGVLLGHLGKKGGIAPCSSKPRTGKK